jgi:hypothetical protein
MSVTRLSGGEHSRYLRCRRQLEMSVGLTVMLLIALLVGPAFLSLRHSKAPQVMANTTPAATSIKRDAAVRAPVRVIPFTPLKL